MKRTRLITPLPLGQFISESWHVAIKPPRRSDRIPGSNNHSRLVRPGEPHAIVCGFCGNTIKVLFCATPAKASRGGRQ